MILMKKNRLGLCRKYFIWNRERKRKSEMTKKEFFDRENKCYFFDDPEEIAKYCKINWPKEVEHILRVADEVCDKYFLFDLKWDMERTYEPVVFSDEPIQWDICPAGDPEFIWQFNRHRFFICLGQAYQLTNDEKYAKAYVELLMDWIKRVPRTPESEKTTWRILEVGLRGEYWSKSFRYFKESPHLTDEVADAFYHSLIQHAEYIVEMHSPYRLISNWGVLENHGLFEIALTLPQSEQTRKYAKTALNRMETEIRMQVMNDGVHWEQSPMYHNEVYHCYLDVLILASRNGIEVSEIMKEKVHKMAYADLAGKKPNHHQFMMGDSDDTDIRDMIGVGAYLFSDPVLKFGGYDILDFEGIWDLGIEAARQYALMEKQEPDFTSAALSDSGNYYMRSGWGEKSNLLHFHCGTLGAGHGHSDKLHVDLIIEGEDVLMDSGRYNYVAGADRYEFKDPTAHNTITVDGKFFTICKDSWECSKLSQPVKQQFLSGPEYEFVQGGHLGYMDRRDGVFVNRKIIHIKPDLYILADELYTGGEHSYEQYFHFNNQGEVLLKNKKAAYSGIYAQADFYFLTPGIICEKIKTRLSRAYNLAEPNDTIKNTFHGNGFASAITVVQGGKKGELDAIAVEKIAVRSALKEIEYPTSMAEGIKIQIRNKTYVVIICHQEVNSPTDLVEADGCLGFGNVIVFDKDQSVEGGTVLNW